MKKLRLRAVALVIANPVGEILVLRELGHKPHIGKFRGSWSIPMETVDSGSDYLATLRQLVEQELGGLASVQMPPRYVGAYRVVPGAWARLFATTSSTYHLPSLWDHDVDGHQWMTAQQALCLSLRQGAREMIHDYVGGLENVRRLRCEEVQNPVNEVFTKLPSAPS